MICIIGGSGFVGTKLIASLNVNNCYNIDKNPSQSFNDFTTIGNICNPDQIRFIDKINNVVLLAAEHRDDVTSTNLH